MVDALALAFVCIAVAWRFIFYDVFYPNVDTATHYRWAAQFAAEVEAGVLRPRWTPLGHFGLGEPAFLYYSPLYFYLVTAAKALIGELWPAMKLVVWVIYYTTALSVYLVLRNRVGRGMACLAAIAVVAAPMTFAVRAMINAYPWFAAFPALVAFTALSVRVPSRPVRQVVLIGLALAVMVLTHILTAFTALVGVGGGLCLAIVIDRDRARAMRRLLVWAAGCGLGLALSAYHLLPAVLSLDLINLYGWHGAGKVNWWDTFAFSFFFGGWYRWLHWLVPSTVYVLFANALLSFARRRVDALYWEETAVLLAIAATALFLACEASYPLWRLFESLQLVQRPFRFLPLATVAVVMAMALLSAARLRTGRDWALAIVLCTVFLAPTLALEALNGRVLADYRGPHMDIGPHRLTEPHLLPEYAVAGLGPDWVEYQLDGGFTGQCGRMGIVCNDLSSSAHSRRFSVDTTRPAVLRLPVLAFPAWVATVNGATVDAGRDPATGLVTVAIPAGWAEICLVWKSLPVERVGMAISLVSLAVTIAATWLSLRRKL